MSGDGVPLLHGRSRPATIGARELGALLGADPRPFAAGEREAAREGTLSVGWSLLDGEDLLAMGKEATARALLLPRQDPRWCLRDPLLRPPERLPVGARVLVPSTLGERLLLRLRADLVPVRLGLPVADEVPALEPGPRLGAGEGTTLDAARFSPPPGTGYLALLPPAGVEVPEPMRVLRSEEAATVLAIERGFLRGVGALPEGAALGLLARRKVSVLYEVRAVLFPAGREGREIVAEIPQADAGRFARGFGEHLLRTAQV